MKLIVGLGNPGEKYRFSRHNLGSLVVEAIAAELKLKFRLSILARSKISWFRRFGKEAALLLPRTFMNHSGQAVGYMVRKRQIALRDILVICDDVNLDFGKLRTRDTGSDGGHKGLKSIIQCLGSKDFSRLRIGIGPAKKEDLSDFVLQEFKSSEKKELNHVINQAVEASLYWLDSSIKEVMNKYNRE